MEVKSDNVLIEPDQKEHKEGAIVLPETAKKGRWETGTVKAVGPGRKPGTMVLEPGQRVMFPKYAGVEVMDGTKQYLIVSQNDIVCEILE